MLAIATLGFALNFWAWALLSPLAPKLKDNLHLTAVQQALVVAVPVVVGSLGRIPVGALTDRFGGRLMFPLAGRCRAAARHARRDGEGHHVAGAGGGRVPAPGQRHRAGRGGGRAAVATTLWLAVHLSRASAPQCCCHPLLSLEPPQAPGRA
jgi:MFS family permease